MFLGTLIVASGLPSLSKILNSNSDVISLHINNAICYYFEWQNMVVDIPMYMYTRGIKFEQRRNDEVFG